MNDTKQCIHQDQRTSQRWQVEEKGWSSFHPVTWWLIPCKARQAPNPQTSHLSCQQGSPPRGGALETKMLSEHELCGHHRVSLCRSLMFPFSSPPSPVMGRVTGFCSDSVRHLGPMLTHPRNPRSWRYLPEHNKFHSLFVYFKFVC